MSLAASLALFFTVSCATNPTMENASTVNEPEEQQVNNPDEIRRGVRMGGENGKSRRQLYYERLIQTVQPDLKGDPEKLPVYTELFKKTLISNPSLFVTDVEATWRKRDKTVVLDGMASFEENRQALHNVFKYLGFENIEDNVEVLPSADLGEKKFGIVKVARTLAYDQPAAPRETMTELLLGEPVYLLKESVDNHFLIAGPDGYISYIDGAAIERMDSKEFTAYQQGSHAIVSRDTAVDLEGGPDFLPAGARLSTPGESGGKVIVRIPGAGEMMVDDTVVSIETAEPDSRAVAAVETARGLLGTDYVWGGKSSVGVDCSGLVQTAYQTLGVHIARDAYMQAFAGKLVATRWYRDGLQAGDTLYFLGNTGRITHTAIYIGDGIYIEASGEVKYSSFNPEDENYDKHRDEGFCFAKRLFE